MYFCILVGCDFFLAIRRLHKFLFSYSSEHLYENEKLYFSYILTPVLRIKYCQVYYFISETPERGFLQVMLVLHKTLVNTHGKHRVLRV